MTVVPVVERCQMQFHISSPLSHSSENTEDIRECFLIKLKTSKSFKIKLSGYHVLYLRSYPK